MLNRSPVSTRLALSSLRARTCFGSFQSIPPWPACMIARPRSFLGAWFRPRIPPFCLICTISSQLKGISHWYPFEWAGVDIRWFLVDGFDPRWITSSFSCGLLILSFNTLPPSDKRYLRLQHLTKQHSFMGCAQAPYRFVFRLSHPDSRFFGASSLHCLM